MSGKVNSGQLVTVEPTEAALSIGDIVLCKVKGNQYLHLIKAIKGHGDTKRYLIGNNRGGTNGWIPTGNIYGRVVEVKD